MHQEFEDKVLTPFTQRFRPYEPFRPVKDDPVGPITGTWWAAIHPIEPLEDVRFRRAGAGLAAAAALRRSEGDGEPSRG